MSNAKTDEPTISVNYTEGSTTTYRLIEMTDDSEHDSDSGSSSHRPLEGIMETDMDTIMDITTSINDVEISIKPSMNSTNNVSDDILQNESGNSPDNLINDTEINFSVVEKSETTENSDRKTGTTTTDEPDQLVNDMEKDTSEHTTPEIDRPSGRLSEIPIMNETEFYLTTTDALEITSDFINDRKTIKITDRPQEVFNKIETEFDFTTISARETTSDSVNHTETDEITVYVLELTTDSLNSNPDTTQDGRQELTINSRNDTEEVTISFPPDTMTNNESQAQPSIIPTETNTNYTQFVTEHEITTQIFGNDNTEVEPTRVGLMPTTENVSVVVTDTEQDISTNTLLETTTKNYTDEETTTIGLRAMTTNVSSTANDTDTTNYPPETTRDPKTDLGSTNDLRSTTGADKFTIGPERKSRNDTDSRNESDQDFTTDSLLETTTKNFTKTEPITVGLGPTTKNDSNITELVDTNTSRPRPSVTNNNSINDTKTEVYTTETGTLANQGK